MQQCAVCQQAKHEHCKTSGLLQPLPIPQAAWQDISLDFIEGLPNSEAYTVIMVVVDRFTKYTHFIALKHPYTAASVARAFLQHVVRLHGIPHSIVSDRDRVFTSTFWKKLFKSWNTTLAMSTAYHPQMDGQTEHVNQCLEMYLRCSIHETPKKWFSWLPLAEFWYNSSFHSSLNCSPFKALYGTEPNYGLLPDLTVVAHPDVVDQFKERQLFSEMLKQQLQKAQLRMKQYANQNRSLCSFQPCEQVYLKLQPYAQTSVVNRPFPKIAHKFFGPFEILCKVGSAAYKLKLSVDSQVHPVFYVSQLKQHIPDHTPVFSTLPVSKTSRQWILSPWRLSIAAW